MSGGARYRDLPLGGSLEATLAKRDDGSTLVVSKEALQPYAARLTDRFLHWAEAAPDRTLVAKRVKGGDWRRVSYAEALAAARSIAQWLLVHPLSVERPIAILSLDLDPLLYISARCSFRHARRLAGSLGGVPGLRQLKRIVGPDPRPGWKGGCRGGRRRWCHRRRRRPAKACFEAGPRATPTYGARGAPPRSIPHRGHLADRQVPRHLGKAQAARAVISFQRSLRQPASLIHSCSAEFTVRSTGA
jgi:hypothetical protein